MANTSAARSGLQNVGGAARWLAAGLGILLLEGLTNLFGLIGPLALIYIGAEILTGLPTTVRLLKDLFQLLFG